MVERNLKTKIPLPESPRITMRSSRKKAGNYAVGEIPKMTREAIFRSASSSEDTRWSR
jgi:hypothetical protein